MCIWASMGAGGGTQSAALAFFDSVLLKRND